MVSIMKLYTGIFFLCLLLLVGAGITSAQLRAAGAQNLKGDIVSALENSRFHPDTIRSSIEHGQKTGYQVRILTYDEWGIKTEHTGVENDLLMQAVLAEVIVSYQGTFAVPWGKENVYEIRGFTRR